MDKPKFESCLMTGQLVEINGQKFFVDEVNYYIPKNAHDNKVVSKVVLFGVRE
jgi:hypothetical protein